MTRRIKGLQFAAVVLVLIGICFGTAHSQSTCTLTYDDINQSSMEHLGGSAETVLQITAEEWEEAVQSEFFQCICSLLDQLGSQTIDSEAFFNEFQSCLVFPPVTVEFILTVDPATIKEDGGSAVLTVSTSHGDNYLDPIGRSPFPLPGRRIGERITFTGRGTYLHRWTDLG